LHSFGYIPKGGIAGSYGRSIFILSVFPNEILSPHFSLSISPSHINC
jgi:hypothetical protein